MLVLLAALGAFEQNPCWLGDVISGRSLRLLKAVKLAGSHGVRTCSKSRTPVRTSRFGGKNRLCAINTGTALRLVHVNLIEFERSPSQRRGNVLFIHFVDHNAVPRSASRCAGIYVIFTLVFYITVCNTFKLCLIREGHFARLARRDDVIFDFQVLLVGKLQRQSLLLSGALINQIESCLVLFFRQLVPSAIVTLRHAKRRRHKCAFGVHHIEQIKIVGSTF